MNRRRDDDTGARWKLRRLARKEEEEFSGGTRCELCVRARANCEGEAERRQRWQKRNKKATNLERNQARYFGIERLRNACRSLRSPCGSNELLPLTILFKSRLSLAVGRI